MNHNISPLYIMELINKISSTLWDKFSSSKYKNVMFYVQKWHEDDGNFWENFTIYIDNNGNIDLDKTLHGIDSETLIKMAIDLGIETPYFIPCVPTFRNTLKDKYKSSHDAFNKAIMNVEENPDIAIGLANSALESIIKNILEEGKLQVSSYNQKHTLTKQVECILKAFEMYPNSSVPSEIKTIGSSLISASSAIEDLRSGKTNLHGKTDKEYVVDNSLYAYFIINAVSTVGSFIDSYYKLHFLPSQVEPSKVVENIFDNDDLPF